MRSSEEPSRRAGKIGMAVDTARFTILFATLVLMAISLLEWHHVYVLPLHVAVLVCLGVLWVGHSAPVDRLREGFIRPPPSTVDITPDLSGCPHCERHRERAAKLQDRQQGLHRKIQEQEQAINRMAAELGTWEPGPAGKKRRPRNGITR